MVDSRHNPDPVEYKTGSTARQLQSLTPSPAAFSLLQELYSDVARVSKPGRDDAVVLSSSGIVGARAGVSA